MDYDPLAALYDAQYRHYRDDLHFYRRLAEDYGGPILELGAGSARVAAHLAQLGLEVWGLEPSSYMMARGKARLAERSVHNVHYLQADMRDFSLNKQFSLILLPFNTLAHAYTLKDQDKTLQRVRAHLAPGGRVALDMFTPNFKNLNVLRLEPEWRGILGQGSEVFVVQEHDAATQLITSTYLVDKVGEDGCLRRERFTLKQRYYYRFELERLFLQHGFSRLQLYGGFEKQPYDASAAHMVVVAGR